MRVVLESYDDHLTVVTPTGAQIDIEATEVKKSISVSGTSDQIVIRARLPIKVSEAYTVGRRGHRECKILVGKDNWDNVEPLDAEPLREDEKDDEVYRLVLD